MDTRYDLIVVGGGPSGIGAAFAAARLNRKVALLERSGFCGGQATLASMALLINRKAHDRYDVSSPIYREVVGRLYERGAAYGSPPAVDTVDIETYKLVLDGMAIELGIDLYYHAWAFEAIKQTEDSIVGVKAVTRGGVRVFHAPLVIDASGSAEIAAVAGCEMELIERPQPMTMVVRFGNVDIERALQAKGHYQREGEPYIGFGGLREYYQEARAAGEWNNPTEGVCLGWSNPLNPSEVLINGNRVYDKHNLYPRSISEAEVTGRKQADEMLKMFRKYIPGYENACLEATGPELGIREDRRIVGEYRLTREDVMEMRTFDDAIAASSYAIDVHDPDGGESDMVDIHKIGKGAYQIPFRCCVPKGVKGLLAVGRCVSADTAAAGSFRVQPVVMSIGQGAVEYALTGESGALAGYNQIPSEIK